MKASNSLRINMSRALELISFVFLGHGPTYPISDLSGSAITMGHCREFSLIQKLLKSQEYRQEVLSLFLAIAEM